VSATSAFLRRNDGVTECWPRSYQARNPMSHRLRAVAFGLDGASLISLREALPGWLIRSIKGATPESFAQYWDPGAADLLVVSSGDNATETLGLCRHDRIFLWSPFYAD
jgi:hypothetical protein